MRSVKFIIAAGAATLLSQAAFAADMAIAPPPQMYAPPPVQDFGGWYLRGDVGMTNTQAKLHVNAYDTLPGNTVFNQFGHGFDSGTLFGLGVGYQFNNWFRADVTGEYRSKVSFKGTDFFQFNPGGGLADAYTGGYRSWVGLVNAYVDLGTWWCLTPFVGAGVGESRNTISSFVDTGATQQGATILSTTFGRDASQWNLALALHAGLAYQVNPG